MKFLFLLGLYKCKYIDGFSHSQASEAAAEIKRKLEKKEKKKKKREKRKLQALSTAEDEVEKANGDAEVLVNNSSSVFFSAGVFRLGFRATLYNINYINDCCIWGSLAS